MNLAILKIKRYSIAILLGAILANATACKEWTEVKPLDLSSPDMEQQNPSLYTKYLEDLRAYKNTAHKVNMGWFNNLNKEPSGQGQHISKVPDSLDFIILEHPLSLVDREISEMTELLNKKATKTIYEIDFSAIKTAFVKKDDKNLVFEDFVKDTVTSILNTTARFPYQGLIVSYQGKELSHLTASEKNQLEAEENLFFGLVHPWFVKNAGKTAIFKGSPQYLINRDILQEVKYIILPTESAVDLGGLSYALLSAMTTNVPTDRFVVSTSMTSYKADESKLGYFLDGSRAALATAQWAASVQNGVQIQGVGYKNLPYDYFNVLKSYQYSRQAIQITNPAMKTK
ncbi:glycoside hydrolase family 18 [Sphingobacterium faecale]|uniref:Lipoprotein n=1 Tax=Sphingobacterium faecale TaxID=2803775 RepID=A0ABS1QZM9_9SPHI|nr:glycoside hydrolase family 18 [Sphingobacterium faecale]MBL1407242.1 hypothetical protein [Sphingobacterium faecale]